ncbi:MAG: bifunctional nuclease family protein [Candidatus Margulisiibacteriota bacterium]
MIEMEVGGLGFDPKNLSPLVLLKDKEELNFLPIWIGIFEATSIAMELQQVKAPRPMTHDLLLDVCARLGAKINKISINEVKDGTFFAVIDLEAKDGKKILIDSRPSDAIALAVRSKAPIFVAEVVMMQAKLVNAEKDAEETKKLKDFIDNMKPEDFTQYYKKD